MLFGHGRQRLLCLLDHAHTGNVLGLQFGLLAFRVHERGPVRGQFRALYFVCGGFDRELVLDFL